MLSCNIPNVVTGLALGSLSDRYGRRPLLLINLATQCMGGLGLVLTMLGHLSLFWMMPFFVVNGGVIASPPNDNKSCIDGSMSCGTCLLNFSLFATNSYSLHLDTY